MSDIVPTILEIRAETLEGKAFTGGLGPHEEEDGLEDLVGELLVAFAHIFPHVVHDPLHRHRTVWQDIPSAKRLQAVVIGLAVRE